MIHVMAQVPPETRALRQTLLAGAVGFVGGFVVVFALMAYVIVRFGWPEERWWVVPDLLQSFFFALFGGLLAAAAFVWLVSRSHYRAGVHRCFRCNRVLQGVGIPCVCDAAATASYRRRQRVPNRALSHYRRRLPWALLVYLLVLPIAWYGASHPDGSVVRPFATKLIALHAILCLLLVVVLHLIDAVAAFLERGRRFRLRAAPLAQLLGAWPVLFFVLLLAGHALGAW